MMGKERESRALGEAESLHAFAHRRSFLSGRVEVRRSDTSAPCPASAPPDCWWHRRRTIVAACFALFFCAISCDIAARFFWPGRASAQSLTLPHAIHEASSEENPDASRSAAAAKVYQHLLSGIDCLADDSASAELRERNRMRLKMLQDRLREALQDDR